MGWPWGWAWGWIILIIHILVTINYIFLIIILHQEMKKLLFTLIGYVELLNVEVSHQ